MTTTPTTALSELSSAQRSSARPVWAWLIGVAVTIVAIYVLWRLRRQAKRIEELERDKSRLAAEVDALKVQLFQTVNRKEADKLQDKITELTSKIDQRNHELAAAKKKAEADKADIDKVTTWNQI